MNLYVASQATRPYKDQQNLAFLQAEPWNLTKAAFFARFPTVFDPTDNFQAISGSAINTPGAIVWNANEMLILSRGTIGTAQAEAMASSWLAGRAYAGDTTMPAVFPEAFDAYRAQCSSIDNGSYANIVLVGHSFGGATMMAGAAILNNVHRTFTKEVYTYGSPRVSYANGFANWHTAFVRRVWLASDPVPNIPPHVEEIPLIGIRLRSGESRNFGMVWQPVGGYVLYADGTYGVAESAPSNAIYGIVPMAEWLAGTNVFSYPAHSLQAYIDANNNSLVLAINQLVPNAPRHGDRVPNPPATQIRALIGRALQTSGSITQANVETAALDIISRVTLLAGVKFKKRSVYGVRTVSYNGAAVASTPKRRFQKAVIKRLNKMLPGIGVG